MTLRSVTTLVASKSETVTLVNNEVPAIVTLSLQVYSHDASTSNT